MFRRLNPIGCPQVEQERLFPWRQTYARYLHVAEAVAEDEAQAAWTGLGGRLKALRREVAAGQAEAEAKAVARQAELEAGLADVKVEVKEDMAEVKADMEEVKAGQAEVKAEMAEVKADVSDMKALLEKLVAQSLQNAA